MYWLMKIVHVLAVVVLLGNLLMAPFWRKRLAAVGGAQARATANRSVRMADLIFTLPGWVVVLLYLAFDIWGAIFHRHEGTGYVSHVVGGLAGIGLAVVRSRRTPK